MPHQRFNHHNFAAIVAVFLIISTLTVVDAFSYRGGITTICKSTHDVHKLSIHHRPLLATTRRDDESTQQSNSIFDQFKMPWDNINDNTDDGGVSWPINSKLDNEKSNYKSQSSTTKQQTKQRKPRVPRYPSALQYDTSTTPQSRSDVVDGYVETAKDALSSIQDNNQQPPSINIQQTTKLGLLLIDHGSKRQASNDHLQSIAKKYQSTLVDKLAAVTAERDKDTYNQIDIAVRAAHMEIAQPSILQQLQQLITKDKVTQIICVPYFLSPGKHATIDIPQLIDEAKQSLEEDGLLYNSNKRIEIQLSNALGTNVDSMLNVVDGLVSMALNDDMGSGGGRDGDIALFQQLFEDINVNTMNKTPPINNSKVNELETELQRYTNRATLLEHALKEKVKELTIMTNRATILEDVLTKLQDTPQEVGGDINSRDNVSAKDREQIKELTADIEVVNKEKEQLVSRIESITLERSEVEVEYKTMISNLKAQLTSIEQERDKLLIVKENVKEVQRNTISNREAELQDEIQKQKTKIKDLQSQLSELLDAHNELEQLQNDTETSLQQMKDQIKVKRTEHETALNNEREEKETYMKKWQDILAELEEDGARMLVEQYNILKPQQLLDENEQKYEAMLEKERSRVDKWRTKWETLHNDTTASAGNSTTTSTDSTKAEEEWASLQSQLEEVTKANVTATAKVKELEKQLKEVQEQNEQNTTSTAQEVEQQQKLQAYLQAQLSTYYETIEQQKNTISEYDQKLDDLKTSHEEAMLIARNSVKASQQREESLLSNVEELEDLLSTAKEYTDSKEEEMSKLQARLDQIEDERERLLMKDNDTKDELAKHNRELAIEVKTLRYRVEEVSLERDHLQLEKRKLQMDILVDMKDDDAVSKGREEVNDQRPRRRWVRAVVRPWTLFRRRK